MAVQKDTPYKAHVFVCTHDRQGARKSCADGQNLTLRQALKEKIAEKGWRPHVRISKCGCLGLCQNGPNVIIYPQKIWFSKVTFEDLDKILTEIQKTLTQ